MKKAFFLIFIGYSLFVSGQNDTVRLDEVVVKGYKLKKYSKGYGVSTISDTTITKNNTSLTDVLRFNTPIYFKEYGNGMLSSPSFRGTSASQTAVVWNGININSQLNGQTDFNTLALTNINSIDVRSGGGSVLFGSGAIGGSVHLNNEIVFKKQHKNKFLFSAGSYNSYIADISTTHSNSKSFLNFGANITRSINDYPFFNPDLKNENGEYERIGFSGSFGVKLNQRNWLKLYSNINFSDRNIARSLNAPSRSKLTNDTSRNLLELNSFLSDSQVLTSRIAYLTEGYKYFESKFSPNNFSKNQANTLIANIDYQQNFSENLSVNALLNYENVNGSGDNINDKSRDVFSVIGVVNHKLSNLFSYSAQIRKEFSSVYNVPLLYSLGVEVHPTKFYTISLNTSKNFRAPTLNDLYWSGGGNPDLNPETAYQFELGNDFTFKNITFGFTGFYIKSTDLIQWRPNSSGIWQPNNVAKAENYGLETQLNIRKNINEHQFSIHAMYALTFAKDIIKQQDLVYVPKHRANFSFNYKFKKASIFYQQLINGERTVFADALPLYSVSNLGIEYQFNSTIKLGGKVHNVFNTAYENYQYYPMPPRNYQLQIQLNI